MKGCQVGVQRNSPAVLGNRILALALVAQHVAEIFGKRLVVLMLPAQGGADGVVEGSTAWVERDGLAVLGKSFVVFMLVTQQRTLLPLRPRRSKLSWYAWASLCTTLAASSWPRNAANLSRLAM
jgi:hypothetical protein